MHFLMKFSFIGEICLLFATYFRFKNNFTEIEKVIEEAKESRKKKLSESFRKSINSEVISSAFNNDVVNDNIDSDNGYMGDKESEKNGDELKDFC